MDNPERVSLGDGLRGLQNVARREVNTGMGPQRARTWSRSSPSMYSMTMYGAPEGSVPTSMTRATCSQRIFAAARASRVNRSATLGWEDACGNGNFSATRCSSSRCIAATTTPIPPTPRMRSTLKLARDDVPFLYWTCTRN